MASTTIIEPQAASDTAHPRRWAILGVLCTSLLLVMLGNTALNLALPDISRDLGLASSAQQWVVDAYSLVFAGLLFTTSSLGDRFGRKGVMQIGLTLFTAATAFAAFFATNGTALIAARATMGLAGAMIMPSTLSILTNVFPANERARAIAIWTAISGGGSAIGMMLSGFMLEHWSWHSVFLLNIPVGLAALGAGALLVPTSSDPSHPRLDIPGAVLSTAGIAAIVYGLIEAPTHGWLSATTLTWLLGGGATMVLFALRELRTESPMLDIRLFRDRAFGVSSLALTLVFFTLMGIFFSISQLFQLVLGFGTMTSAFALAPVFLAMIVVGPQAPKIVARIGTRRAVGRGMALIGVGLAILALLPADPGYPQIALGMTVMAVGMALAMSPTTDLLMASVPRHRAGMGAAMNDTTRELGGALGVAVLGSVLASQYASNMAGAVAGLPVQAGAAAQSSLAGAVRAAAVLPADQGGALVAAAKSAWMGGLSTAMVVGTVIIAAAALLARFGLPAGAVEETDDDIEGELTDADLALLDGEALATA